MGNKLIRIVIGCLSCLVAFGRWLCALLSKVGRGLFGRDPGASKVNAPAHASRPPRASRKRMLGLIVLAVLLIDIMIPLTILVVGNKGPEPPTLQWQLYRLSYPVSFKVNEMRASASQQSSKVYEVKPVTEKNIGIDVSEHQGIIDWQLVAQNGVGFVFLRLGARGYTEGNIVLDAQYQANIEGASNAGLEVGVYFFSQAVNEDEARAEANFVLDQLAGRHLDLPVVYDLEQVSDSNGRINSLSGQQRSQNARAFCEIVEAAGYQAMLYGNAYDLARYDLDLLRSYDIWFAHYNVSRPMDYFVNFSIWQCTSTALINGIHGFVDLNIRFGPTEIKQLPGSVEVQG